MRKRVKKEKEDPIVSLPVGWGRWHAEQAVLDVILHLLYMFCVSCSRQDGCWTRGALHYTFSSSY